MMKHATTRSARGARRLALTALLALVVGALAGPGPATADLTGQVNVNSASVEELQLLPGVGEVRARAIAAAREARGGFEAVAELEEVKGIGSATLEKLRPFVRLEGETTARME